MPDGPGSGMGPPPLTARRIVLTIAAGKVAADLDNFPVLVTLSNVPDLMTRLDNDRNLSFRQRTGETPTSLPFEVQSYNTNMGSLTAWVRLPRISAAQATVFELLYGRPEVKVAENKAAVWAGEYLSVFHLEDTPNGANSIKNSANDAQNGTPTSLAGGDLKPAQLGDGFDFDGNTEVISFANPLSGNGPSTISAWVNQRATSDNDVILALGDNGPNQARILYSRLDSTAEAVGSNLSNDQHVTGTSIEAPPTNPWKLVHWVYENQTGRVYVDGVLATNGMHTYNNAANTQAGGMATIGNADSETFGENLGAKATLDEVRISQKPRTAAWAAAEAANQSVPSTFLTIGTAEDTQVRL